MDGSVFYLIGLGCQKPILNLCLGKLHKISCLHSIVLTVPMSLLGQNRVQQRLPRFLESHLHSTKAILTILFCATCNSYFLRWAFDTLIIVMSGLKQARKRKRLKK